MSSVPFYSAGFVQPWRSPRTVSDSYNPIREKRRHSRELRIDIGFNIAWLLRNFRQKTTVAQSIIEERDSDYYSKQREIKIISKTKRDYPHFLLMTVIPHLYFYELK